MKRPILPPRHEHTQDWQSCTPCGYLHSERRDAVERLQELEAKRQEHGRKAVSAALIRSARGGVTRADYRLRHAHPTDR